MNPSKLVKLMCSVLFLSFAAIAWACYWDSDTLRTEAKGVPGVVEAVTGFFPVYPDEYYERRIEIAEERLAADPDRLESYDDIAVSLDRLGDSTAAIESIKSKLEVVERLGDDAGDHLYRYHANIGTFHAHRWIRNGGDAEDLADLEAAREHISKAIEINPDAHFGREFVQLGIVDWLLDEEAGEFGNTWISRFPTPLSQFRDVIGENFESYSARIDDDKYKELVDGFVGLIVLGDAWESVDVVGAIGILMMYHDFTSVSVLCGERIDDLASQGRTSIHPFAFETEGAEVLTGEWFSYSLIGASSVEKFYKKSMRSSERYRTRYASFVQKQLDAGMYPDTHSNFFDGVPKARVPRLPNGWFGYGGYQKYIAMGITCVVLLVACFVARHTWKKKRPSSTEISTG